LHAMISIMTTVFKTTTYFIGKQAASVWRIQCMTIVRIVCWYPVHVSVVVVDVVRGVYTIPSASPLLSAYVCTILSVSERESPVAHC